MNVLNEHANGILPSNASPAATPIMFDSAMPTSKNRSGYFAAKSSTFVEFFRSPVSATTRSSAPMRTSASPKALRVATSPMSAFPFDLGDRARALHGIGRLAVPVVIELHEADAFPFDRVGDDGRRLAL